MKLLPEDWEAGEGAVVCPPQEPTEADRKKIATLAAYLRLMRTADGYELVHSDPEWRRWLGLPEEV